MSKKSVRESLIEQLKAQNKYTAHNIDMVDKYMELWDLAKSLKQDIRKKGLRYTVINGNGFEVEKDNQSVRNFSATIAAMQNIRQKMRLDDPIPEKESDDSDYL